LKNNHDFELEEEAKEQRNTRRKQTRDKESTKQKLKRRANLEDRKKINKKSQQKIFQITSNRVFVSFPPVIRLEI